MFNTPNINKVMMVGNVVSNPHVSVTNETQAKVCNFRIVSNRKYRTKANVLKDEACFINVTAWLRLAEICERNLEKGDRVYVEGLLQSKTLADGRTSVIEILAEKVQILTSKRIMTEETYDKENTEEESN
jgi:single-strand DNA-binding protein